MDKWLSKQVLGALKRDENFFDCYQIACNNSNAQPYLVGGKLFRTIIEVLYEYPARAASCDYDFATASIIKRKKKKIGKKRRRRGGYGAVNALEWDAQLIPTHQNPCGELIKSNYSNDSLKLRTRSGCKIDVISIPDLEMPKSGLCPPDIGGYLQSVPLSIQSIAMDLERCEIFGSVGIDSINERFVWINNKDSITNLCKHKGWNDLGNSYIIKKATSIKFRHDVRKVKQRLYKTCFALADKAIFDSTTVYNTINYSYIGNIPS